MAGRMNTADLLYWITERGGIRLRERKSGKRGGKQGRNRNPHGGSPEVVGPAHMARVTRGKRDPSRVDPCVGRKEIASLRSQ